MVGVSCRGSLRDDQLWLLEGILGGLCIFSPLKMPKLLAHCTLGKACSWRGWKRLQVDSLLALRNWIGFELRKRPFYSY